VEQFIHSKMPRIGKMVNPFLVVAI